MLHSLLVSARKTWSRFQSYLSNPPTTHNNTASSHISHTRGTLGEIAAKQFLSQLGYHFILANFKSPRGEIDLIFSHADCLIFVEVKTRSSEKWQRPSRSVNHRKRRALNRVTHDYLHQIRNPRVRFRFDIVEVLLEDGVVREIRHLPNAVTFTHGLRL